MWTGCPRNRFKKLVQYLSPCLSGNKKVTSKRLRTRTNQRMLQKGRFHLNSQEQQVKASGESVWGLVSQSQDRRGTKREFKSLTQDYQNFQTDVNFVVLVISNTVRPQIHRANSRKSIWLINTLDASVQRSRSKLCLGKTSLPDQAMGWIWHTGQLVSP